MFATSLFMLTTNAETKKHSKTANSHILSSAYLLPTIKYYQIYLINTGDLTEIV